MLAETFPSSQRRARSASPAGRSLKRSGAERSDGADGVARKREPDRAKPQLKLGLNVSPNRPPRPSAPLLCEEGNILFAFRRRANYEIWQENSDNFGGSRTAWGTLCR